MADEYIRKQDAVDALDRIFDNVPMELTTEILRLRRELRGLPSADVAPVVHARWILRKTDCNRYRECSACNVWLLWNMPRNSYCPNCGAKMDGKGEE